MPFFRREQRHGLPPGEVPAPTVAERRALERFHRWYYDSQVWRRTAYRGIPIQKWVGDLWSYQEILQELRPTLLVEFGTNAGGSALWFADTLERIRPPARVLTVDVNGKKCATLSSTDPRIERMLVSSTDPGVAVRIQALRAARPGPVFAILDSDHAKAHVLAEMESLRDVLFSGDVLIVEDGNVNGHPVYPTFGEGPLEAARAYAILHPDDYERDVGREAKFGFTFAPEGFLRRR